VQIENTAAICNNGIAWDLKDNVVVANPFDGHASVYKYEP